MNRIGLIDVDGHNFPNFALMKISDFHKKQGDSVEWYNGIEHYEKVYMSKIFTFTPDDNRVILADEVVRGGTGYNMDNLPAEIESAIPDYSIYPISDWYDGVTAYGFLTRGCIRKCPWCIVPEKDGRIKPYRDIEDVLQGSKKAILMDNNILACDYGLEQIEKIINLKCKVDFNQGLDARLVTDDIAKMLSKVKWIRHIRFACDTASSVDPFISALEKLNKYGVKNYKVLVYLLVQDVKEANIRSEIMKQLGVDSHAQPYRDFIKNIEPTIEQRRFARYVNCREIYNSISWEEYNSSKRVVKEDKRQMNLFNEKL